MSAGGINKFTSTLAAIFLVTAILLAATSGETSVGADPGGGSMTAPDDGGGSGDGDGGGGGG